MLYIDYEFIALFVQYFIGYFFVCVFSQLIKIDWVLAGCFGFVGGFLHDLSDTRKNVIPFVFHFQWKY